MEGFFSTQGNRLLGALVLIAAAIALISLAILNFEEADRANYEATISVEGSGEVLAVPDIATFTFSVEAEGEDATQAQSESAEKINAILAYLKEQGIEEKDIKTANYNLYPKYRYEERVCAFNSYCPPGERVEDGYTASQMVTVKVRETEKAGDLLSGVGERGATNISSLSFTIDDMEVLKTEARDKAIADARQKAEALADSLGVKLVRIVGYYENAPYYGGYGGEFYAREEMAMDSAMSLKAPAPELPSGEQSTKVMVNVTYEIK